MALFFLSNAFEEGSFYFIDSGLTGKKALLLSILARCHVYKNNHKPP
jgi:hypothetical protein